MPYHETQKRLIKSAKKNNASNIRLFNQYQLLKAYNPSFFIKSLFPSIISLDQRGLCYALVGEWYYCQRVNQDLFKKLKSSCHEHLLKKLTFIQSHHRELTDGVKPIDQPLDRGDRYKTYGLEPSNLVCQENWIKDSVPHSMCWYLESITEAAEYKVSEESYEERREYPKDKNQFFGVNQFDFHKLIEEAIDEHELGSLKEIFILSDKRINHFIGFTVRLNEKCEKEYVIFDPDFGEFTFNSLKEIKAFLCEYITMYYININADKDLCARVDITTFRDTEQFWPKNSANNIKNNLLKNTNLKNIYPLLNTQMEVSALLEMANTPEEILKMRTVLEKNDRVAALLPELIEHSVKSKGMRLSKN
jgi:hypothetical protein